MVSDTKLKLLKLNQQEVWSRLGHPEMVIYDGGPPYEEESTSERLLGKDKEIESEHPGYSLVAIL